MHNYEGKAPGLYDISGSAHFINKCDNGIVVHRTKDPEGEIPPDHVQKVSVQVRMSSGGRPAARPGSEREGRVHGGASVGSGGGSRGHYLANENYPALTGGWSGCPDGQL
eukprot:978938-Pyramimonas_sp.AAC.1